MMIIGIMILQMDIYYDETADQNMEDAVKIAKLLDDGKHH